MENRLIQGKKYSIPFVKPYTEKGPYFVTISAIAKKDTLSIYGDFDIRGTFFDNVGIKTYLEMVNDTTDIYICHPIKSTEPIEIDEGSFIFIPNTIIDYPNVEEYKISTKYLFNIEGIWRNFELNSERLEFLNSLYNDIPIALNSISKICNDIISLSHTESEFLISEKSINASERERDIAIGEKVKQENAQRKNISNREMDYYRRINDVSKRENEVKVLKERYNTLIRQAENAVAYALEFQSAVGRIEQNLKDIHTDLQESADLLGQQIPSWETIYDRNMNDNPSENELKDLLNDYNSAVGNTLT